MSSTFGLLTQSSWSVRTMSVKQIPLVASWIASIYPRIEVDQQGLTDQMQREMEEASEIGISEYYIGYFGELSTFLW